MSRTTSILMGVRSMMKLYESMLKEVCEEYQLAQIEVTIISFLYNNPGKDTAGDIAELRMLSKGNVSQAVENLIQKSLIQRIPDESDRRRFICLFCRRQLPSQNGSNWWKSHFAKKCSVDFPRREADI